ncbi:MAG: glycosyltransferase family 4 protein [Parcubacteria group bacterium]|nr:glycosyltransferase family 4 protein [Parcubacteria group bacterium]
MRIGILLHPYDEDKPAGLGRTILGFVTGMLEADSENEYIIFVKKRPRENPQLPGKNWKLHVLGEGTFWLDRMRHAPSADIYIFHTPVMPFFWQPPKSIVIALDFAYQYLPTENLRTAIHNKILGFYHGVSLKRARHIVSISQTTKDEIIKLYGISPDKISVVYMGFDSICQLPEEKIDLPRRSGAKAGLPEKFFLFVGVLKPRKNPLVAIKAFTQFYKNNPGYMLVVAGKGGGPYYEEMRKYIRDHGIEQAVKFTGFITDNQLSYMYKRAFALVFPSIFEGGFALPVFEAMDCGLPVITSGQGPYESLEETVKDAALLINPLQINEIANAMERVVSEKGLRENLIKKGREHAKKFSWNKAGRELLNVVQKLT